MLGASSFNNMLNANSFNHIFAPITPPPPMPPSSLSIATELPSAVMSNSSASTIIDLSNVGEPDDDLEIVNVSATTSSITAAATAAINRKRHHTDEFRNESKRYQHVPYSNENQKNVPLKKRGVSNNTQSNNDEILFLSLVSSEDSNQAQNLKISRKSDSACDSTSASTGNASSSVPKHILETTKDKESGSSNSKVPSSSSICNCLDCFPTLGSSSGSRPKCNKLNKQQRLLDKPSCSSSSSTTSITIPVVEAKIDVSLIPGPSGLQNHTNQMPVKKRSNYYESDEDYDSEDGNSHLISPESILPQVNEMQEVTEGALTAPHLQLDWLSDEGTSQGEEEDDDVIFVSDRAEPIDLTADSDSDIETRANQMPSSVDEERNIDNRLNGNQDPSQSVSPIWPLPISIEEPRTSFLLNVNAPTLERTSSSVEIPPVQQSSSAQQSNPPQVVITMNSRPRLDPRAPRFAPSRPISYHEMITGNDVMLYDGAQNYSSTGHGHQARPSVVAENSNQRPRTILVSSPAAPLQSIQNQQPQHHHHHNQPQPSHHGGGGGSAYHHLVCHQPRRAHHHHRPTSSPNFNLAATEQSGGGSTETNSTGNTNAGIAAAPTQPIPNSYNQSLQQQQQQQQNCRQHVGRCPFMTEGHHYNRPRRLQRDYFPSLNNGRPYAVHEDLWRRQYQEQEIRRHYWSSTFNEAPEVHVLRPPPATSHAHQLTDPFVHRLVSAANDANNPTASQPMMSTNELLNLHRNSQRNALRLRRAQW
jgi:hypothetical protein